MTKFGVPTEEQLTKINKLSKRTLSEDEVFAFSGKAAGDMLIPGRYIRLSPELLGVMVEDAQKGVSFMLNHNWSNWGGIQAVPFGKVFDGRLENSSGGDEAVEMHLDKYIVRDDEMIDNVSANALIKKIETGVLSDTSIGWSTDIMVCSICGMNYYSGNCSHIRGRTYDMADGSEKLCFITAMPPSIIIPYHNNALMEESIVWDGAYPGAAVTQTRCGDIIETSNGNFKVLQDKEELPEGTLFRGYYHNGDIMVMVKKSDSKKIFAIGKPEIKKDGEKQMDTGIKLSKEVQKMFEAFGIECKDGEDMDVAKVLNQLGEKWDKTAQALKDAAPPLTPPPEAFMTQEQVKEKLGDDLKADAVLELAKEGQEYRKQVIEDTVTMGVRAQGNDFPAETWKSTFAAMSTKAIKDIMATFEKQAKQALPDGRHTDPAAGKDNAAALPDESFKV